MSGAGAILDPRLSMMPNLQPRSPLSRSAGEGPGVRAALTSPLPPPLPRWGEEGGIMPLTSPPAPSSPTLGRGGGDGKVDSASVNDTVSSDHPSPAARERGRG